MKLPVDKFRPVISTVRVWSAFEQFEVIRPELKSLAHGFNTRVPALQLNVVLAVVWLIITWTLVLIEPSKLFAGLFNCNNKFR